MSVSDADFAAWLEHDNTSRVVLWDLDYVVDVESIVGPDTIHTPTIKSLGISSRPYVDSNGVPYHDCVINDPEYSRELNRDTLSGAGAISIGTLQVANPEGLLDHWLALAVDGSECRCYVGDVSWARADFRKLYTATTQRIDGTDRTLTVYLRDGTALLNASLGGTFLGGTGPNAQRTKPENFGFCNQCELLQTDAADLVYCYGSQGNVRFGSVRDNGASISDLLQYAGIDSVLIFDVTTNRLPITAHGFINEDILHVISTSTYPAGLAEGYYFVRNKTADDFQLSSARAGAVVDITSATFSGTLTLTRYNYQDHQDGTLTLAHPPTGRLTCDVLRLITLLDRSAYFVSDILRTLVVDYSTVSNFVGNVTPDHFTIGDPNAFDPADGDFLIGLRSETKANILALLEQVAYTGAVFFGFDRDNGFVYGRINPAVTGVTPVMYFTDDDIVGGMTIARADPAYISFNFVFNRNWTVLTDFLAMVSAEDVAKFSAKGRYGSGYEQGVMAGDPPVSPPYSYSPELWHKTMAQGSEVDTLLSAIDTTEAFNQGTAWFRLYRQMFFPWLEFIDVEFGMRAYTLEWGSFVSWASARFGTITGQVVRIAIRPVSGAVGLTLCRRRAADVSETDHLG